MPTSRRAPSWCWWSPTRSRTWWCASCRPPPSTARAFARTPPARCCCRGAHPGKRTPLWQQRLKAQSLLEVAKRYGQFPIVLETYRECLRDVLDLPGLEELLRGLHTRELSLVEAETQRASPFASSLLFDYVATYMYEGDTPNAERRAAALSLDRDLLRELLGQEELRDLIDPAALAEVEADLQRRSERTRAANADSLHDVLRAGGRPDRRGDRASGCCPTCRSTPMLEALVGERRAVQMRIGGEDRWIASEDAGLYRDAFGAVPPGGLPAAFLDETPDPFRGWCGASRAPTARSPPASWPTATASTPRRCCRHSRARAAWCAASCGPGGSEREWCDTDVLRRLRRASLAVLRKEVEPAEQRALARFLPSWQGVDTSPPGGAGVDRLREVLVPLQGVALAPGVWEAGRAAPPRGGVLGRVARPAVRVGRAGVGGRRRAGSQHRQGGPLLPRGRAAGSDRRTSRATRLRGRVARRDPRAPARRGARSGPTCWPTSLDDPAELQEALWDLVWAGEVTNDAFAPLRAPRLSLARERRRPAAPLRAPPASRHAAGAGPLVAHRAAVRGRA